MKITKRQLKRIIREERSRLLSEQVTDGLAFQNRLEASATEVSDFFGETMHILFSEEPEMFEGVTSEQWDARLQDAQLDLDTRLVRAMEEAIAEVEATLLNQGYTGPTP